MEEHALQYQQSYKDFKAELDHEMHRAAQGFVRIGYLLRKARDTDILIDSPYKNVLEFAEKEYGLDKSQTSRFIAINERFGDPDDPEQLAEQYRPFGVKKLNMMLMLPDSLNEVLTDDYTAAEIAEIKAEVTEEQKITPLEVMAEEQDHTDLSMLARVLYKIGEDDPEMMMELMGADYLSSLVDELLRERLLEILAPAGQKMYMARVQGVGKMALVINGRRITLTNVREDTKEEYTPEDIEEELGELYRRSWTSDAVPDTAKQMWELIYQREVPEVAPVQPKKETKVSTPAKNTKTEPKTAKNDKKPQKTDGNEPKPNGTLDRDELMPEPVEEEEQEEQKSTVTDLAKIPARESKGEDNTVRGWKAGLSHDIGACERMLRDKQYRALRTKLEQMLQIVKRIIDYTEGE